MNQLVIRGDRPGATISRHIYGHFAEHLGRCIYEGFWVGEDSPIPHERGIRLDVVEAMRRIRPPVLRWPGGCFADEYHWMDGIGPREKRASILNTHWGRVVENNHFGTHEFFDLCALLGADPYICGNVGSGTVHEMQQWVEYITFDGTSPMADLRRHHGRQQPWSLPFFGVGNENWGCGGQMRPEYYADLYRRYQTYVRHLSGNRVQKIACGPNAADYRWTEVLMREAGRAMQGLALHYYTRVVREGLSRSATQFGPDEWFEVLRGSLVMDTLLTNHSAIMDRFDPQRRVGLVVDEWGTWYDVEPGTEPGFLYQQNTMRDALVAGLTFHVFHRHCQRVRMANIAQTANVLQAMVLTRGAEMVLTPTYHVFEMFSVHQDGTSLPADLSCDTYSLGGEGIPALSASASRAADGTVHLSLCNAHHSAEMPLRCALPGIAATEVSGRVLAGAAITTGNSFEQPEAVRPVPFTDVTLRDGGLETVLPPHSVTVLQLR